MTLLIPIITPAFLRSPACREELTHFVARERALGRGDLILPVYYVTTPELDDPERRDADELARVLAARQYADWRELRFEPLTSPVIAKALAHLATRMRDTFWHQPQGQPSSSGGSPPVVPRAGGSEASVTEKATAAKTMAKTEPPTHVVDVFPQRGDFTTISSAIAAAQPGDRILVRPGVYQEGLVVDKPLEILGDGPVADIEVQARDADALLFQANFGRVANLTLRQVGGRAVWYGIDITQGRLELEGCDVSSEQGPSVVIRNGADPRLRRNRIQGGRYTGVMVHDSGLGTLEDNDIAVNGYSGIEIHSGGNPTVRRNRIHDNKHNGCLVHTDGLGILEDNDIAANGYAGVEIRNGGNPTVRGNRINRNSYTAVWVHNDGRGMIEDNDLTGNKPGPWTIDQDSEANVTRVDNRE